MVSFFLLLASTAFASDPSAACFSGAEHPAASMRVVVNDVEVVSPTHALKPVFSAVASADPEDTVHLDLNEAGTKSIKAAMNCFLDNDTVTWSMMRMHQVAPELAVRSGLFRLQKNGRTRTLDQVAMGGQSGQPIFVFSQESVGSQSCVSVALNAESALAKGDWYFQASPSMPEPGQTCTGVNCTACAFNTSGWGCAPCADPGDPAEPAFCNHGITSGGTSGGFVPNSDFLVVYEQ